MKSILIISTLFLCLNSFGQTAIISNKSHSGDLALVNFEPDNFGGRLERVFSIRKVDTVILFDKCIIEMGSNSLENIRFRDTVCHNEFLVENNYSKESARLIYPQATTFIGFPEDDNIDNNESIDRSDFWTDGNPFERGGTGLLGIILISYLLYLFTPSLKKR